jgi:hypothetical protein
MILLLMATFWGSCAAPIGSPPTPVGPARPTVAPIDTAQTATTPTLEVARYRSELPDLGEAPELNNEVWLNTDRPVRLADVRGKVVVLDMWTFG